MVRVWGQDIWLRPLGRLSRRRSLFIRLALSPPFRFAQDPEFDLYECMMSHGGPIWRTCSEYIITALRSPCSSPLCSEWGPKSCHGRPPVPKSNDSASPFAAGAATGAAGGAAAPCAEGGTVPAPSGSPAERAPPQKLSKGLIKRLERREEMRRQHGGAGDGAAASAAASAGMRREGGGAVGATGPAEAGCVAPAEGGGGIDSTAAGQAVE